MIHDHDHRCSVGLLSWYCVRSVNRIPRYGYATNPSSPIEVDQRANISYWGESGISWPVHRGHTNIVRGLLADFTEAFPWFCLQSNSNVHFDMSAVSD